MTDWLPWGAIVMAGAIATAAVTLRQIGRTPVGTKPDLRPAWWTLAASSVAALAVYALYLVYGESWVWYLR